MSKNKRPNIEKVVSIIIVGLIACFFCVEMFCKLPSGEDLLQATCKAEHAGLSGYIDCVLAGWKNIPRIGEAYQHAVIPFFHNLPNFSLETLFRLIDVFLCVGIIYLIVYLTKGRQPEFSYKDSTLAALATFFLATSSFTQLFFKGFSNVHNYLIAVFFTLLFIKLWFFAPKRTKVMPVMCLIVGALAGCATELNPFVILGVIVSGALWAHIRKMPKRKICQYLKAHLWLIIGIVLGLVIQAIVSKGWSASIGRSGSYGETLSISGIWQTPLTTIPQICRNIITNLVSYCPALLLAGVAMIFLTRRGESTRKQMTGAIIGYAIIYLIGCFPTEAIISRISLLVFYVLSVPTIYVISELLERVPKSAIKYGVAVVVALLVAMNIDNAYYHHYAIRETNEILQTVQNDGELNQQYLSEHQINTKSALFGFKHEETPFSYTDLDWYPKNYLIYLQERQFYPIIRE